MRQDKGNSIINLKISRRKNFQPVQYPSISLSKRHSLFYEKKKTKYIRMNFQPFKNHFQQTKCLKGGFGSNCRRIDLKRGTILEFIVSQFHSEMLKTFGFDWDGWIVVNSFPARCQKPLQVMKQSSMRYQGPSSGEKSNAKLLPSQPFPVLQPRTQGQSRQETNISRVKPIKLPVTILKCSFEDKASRAFDKDLSTSQSEEGDADPIFISRSKQYFVDPHFLKDTQVNELMRALLNEWMIGSAEEHYYSRGTYALASFYVDTYLSRRPVTKKELQLVGYTALTIASKLEEGRPPSCIPKHVTNAQVAQMQIHILLALEFKLNTDTYIYWLNRMMAEWDQFVKKNTQYAHVTYHAPELAGLRRSLEVFELADCINFDVWSWKFSRPELMLNLFVIVNMKNIRGCERFPENVEDLWKLLRQMEEYLQDTLTCVRALGSEVGGLNEQAVLHIFEFLQLQISYSLPQSPTQHYLKFLNVQTLNSNMFPYMKRLHSLRKNK